MSTYRFLGVFLAFTLLLEHETCLAQTQTVESVLYAFQGYRDGARPAGGLITDGSGAIFGTARQAGATDKDYMGFGVVFKLIPPAEGQKSWRYEVLHEFQGGRDGSFPVGSLVFDASGALYGATHYGGFGTVFQLTPPPAGQTKWTHRVLYHFKGGTDGQKPNGSLIFDHLGALYGTTRGGGEHEAFTGGTAFMLAPNGQMEWQLITLYRFKGGADQVSGDGLHYNTPYDGLIFDRNGTLYGSIHGNGNRPSVTSELGTIFQLKPPPEGQTQWTYTPLYRFKGGTDGANPTGTLLLDNHGSLYGVTSSGGSYRDIYDFGAGTVFKLNPPQDGETQWKKVLLYAFPEPNGEGKYDGRSIVGSNCTSKRRGHIQAYAAIER